MMLKLLSSIFIISSSTILFMALAGVLIARIEAVLYEEENIFTYLWAGSGALTIILLTQVWLEIIISSVFSVIESKRKSELNVSIPSDSESDSEEYKKD